MGARVPTTDPPDGGDGDGGEIGEVGAPATAVVGADGGEVLALQLYQLQLSILNDDGCASEAQALPGELAPVICAQYQSAIDALDAGDQLVVRLDGVEVQSLSKATANGNFFTPDVVLDIDTFSTPMASRLKTAAPTSSRWSAHVRSPGSGRCTARARPRPRRHHAVHHRADGASAVGVPTELRRVQG